MIVALLTIAAALSLVRLGWERRRSVAAFGWIGGLAALAWLTLHDGAWGLAVGTTTGIVVALVIVLHAAWASPPRTRRTPRPAPSITIPYRWADIARRIAVFVLVVPGAFVAAQWLAFGAQALARRGGYGEADAIVLTLFLQPVLWGVIMTIQMTRANAARMIAPPVVAAVLGTILWGAA